VLYQVPEKILLDASSVSSLYKISDTIGAAIIGSPGVRPFLSLRCASATLGGFVGGTWEGVAGRDVVLWGWRGSPGRPVGCTEHDASSSLLPGTNLTGFCAAAGDARWQCTKARQECHEFRHKFAYNVPVSYLARRMGDIAQVYTQHAYMRPIGAATVFCGIDEEVGPQLFTADPSGVAMGFKAVSVGAKEQEAMNMFEKRFKTIETLSTSETINLAISTLQSTLQASHLENCFTLHASLTVPWLHLTPPPRICQMDFKPGDIEVGIVTSADPKFRTLNEDEIDAALVAIAERD